MALDYIVPIGHDDGRRIASALEIIAGRAVLEYDETTGEYTNASIAAYLSAHRDGLAYGVSIPKGNAVACTKIGANAGIPNPTPGIVGRAAVDPYVGRGPFFFIYVNATVDANGYPHVTAVEGDGKFRIDGSNGDVWILAPVLYYLLDESLVMLDESLVTAVTLSVSDTRLAGMAPQPQAYLPDGTLRPYMLYAAYVGVKGSDGYMHSYSGLPAWVSAPSHNALITECRTATTGYSGKSIGDDFYIKAMFLLKYATKHSQSVFAGCTSYNLNYAVTVAESDVTRAIIAKANAANLVVGSTVAIGTADKGEQIAGKSKILKIEDYDSDNSAIYLDTPTAFTTSVGNKLCTLPWFSGMLNAVEGDGTITDAGRTNGKEPFKLQGIELAMGCNEVLGDVILDYDGTNPPEICINYDSRNEATSVTSNYTRTGKRLHADASEGWHYPVYPSNAGGLLYGAGNGASTTAGMCDGHYMNTISTVGTREWLGLGHLNDGANAGVWYVLAAYGLGDAYWYIGSRLSGIGRSRAAA